MNNFTKLSSAIVTSTIWQEDNPTRIVWVTMLATADACGRVEGSIPGLAHIARVTVEECERALDRLMSPDPYSRTKDREGRRVEEIDGGWRILNYGKYRERRDPEKRREQTLKAVRRHRQKKNVSQCKPNVSQGKPGKAQAEEEEEEDITPPTPPGGDARFEDFWKVYPRKVAKAQALKAWKKIKPSAELAAEIIAAVGAYARTAAWTKDGGQYIPHASTFLNQRRWEDELPDASGSPTPDLPPPERDAAGKTRRDYLLDKLNPMGARP